MHQATPKTQSVKVSSSDVTLGALVEVTAHAWCPITAVPDIIHSLLVSTRQENA